MARIRITTLVENDVEKPGLIAEHGLAFWIETAESAFLFDTGQGEALAHNARRLGVTLDSPDAIVLSHGHYDHTGGLPSVLHRPERKRLYAHPAAFAPKFARNADGTGRDVGIPEAAAHAVQEMAELILMEEPREIGDGLFLTGPIPRQTDFEDTGGPFFVDPACSRADDLIDDQAAFLETQGGTVVLLGCAHVGVINTLLFVRDLTGGTPIRLVAGGMHLRAAGRERLLRTITSLHQLGVERLLPCHCTGAAAIERLRREFPGRCTPCPAGTSIAIDD